MEVENRTSKKQSNDSNGDEMEEYLSHIYVSNMTRINLFSSVIKLSQISGIISFLIFLGLLTFKVNPDSSIPTFFLLIPALVTLVSYTIVLNMYLKLKDIIDEVEAMKTEDDGVQIGSIISYSCLNLAALSVFVYLILLTLKVDNDILASWNVIAVPAYIFYGVVVFYIIFITPAFIENKFYSEVSLLYSYVICSLVFFLLMCLKLDRELTATYPTLFIPLFFTLGLHLVHAFIDLLSNFKSEFYSKILMPILIMLIFLATILVSLKAEKITHYPNFVPVLMWLISFVALVSPKFWSLISEKEDE